MVSVLSHLPAIVASLFITVVAAYDFSPDWTVETPLRYSRALAQAFLDAHNARRAAPPRSAANMRRLEWNASLAAAAARHVRQCAFEHDTLNWSVGQALALSSTPTLDAAQANATLAGWVERDLVAHPLDEHGRMPLNFASQILWAETASVGCASQWCPNTVRHAKGATGVLTACDYFPPGNFPDRQVLKVGPPCSLCPPEAPYCDATLCTSERYTFASRLTPIDPSIPIV